MISKKVNLVVVGLLLVFLVACVPTAVKKFHYPNGWASYQNAPHIKAVSPEGVVYRVRVEKNEPYAELPFLK